MNKMYTYYVYNEKHEPVVSDRNTWERFRRNNGLLFMDKVLHKKVRTTFKGYSEDNKDPVLFRTTVYNNINSTIYVENYKSYAHAKKGHKEAIAWVLVNSDE